MQNDKTDPLPTSYLLFPRAELPRPMLMALDDEEACRALMHMDLIRRINAMDATVEEIVVSGYRFSDPTQDVAPGGFTGEQLTIMGWHAHPDLAPLYKTPTASDIQLHMQPHALYPTWIGYRAMEAPLRSLLMCRLATAPSVAVPGVFADLVTHAPAAAAEVLKKGLVFLGRKDPVRNLAPLLTRNDLLPLLEADDPTVRERTLTCLRSVPNASM